METIAQFISESWFESGLVILTVLLLFKLFEKKNEDGVEKKIKSAFSDKLTSACLYLNGSKSATLIFHEVSEIELLDNELHVTHRGGRSLMILGSKDYLLACGDSIACKTSDGASVELYLEGSLIFKALLYDFTTGEDNVIVGYGPDGADAYAAFGSAFTLIAEEVGTNQK
jgi:hypothetical protein